jgi:hypothetical protein
VKIYDPATFSWGYEIEWGDIPRSFDIPEHLGTWEFAETDILNLNGEWAMRAVDPLGIDPPMGGEINTKPTATWGQQVDRILEIKQLFVNAGHEPTASLVNHGHLHVYVPGLKEDVAALKRLVAYIRDNQLLTVERCYGYYDDPTMKGAVKGAKAYLKQDGGRQMPGYMIDNILNLARSFEHFIKLHAAGKDGVSMGRPFRYAINTYCMKHTGTVEFRCFRSSTNREEIASQFAFAEAFIGAALNGGPSVEEILEDGNFKFPPYIWNREHWDAWASTKWDKSRGKKVRNYYEVQ